MLLVCWSHLVLEEIYWVIEESHGAGGQFQLMLLVCWNHLVLEEIDWVIEESQLVLERSL